MILIPRNILSLERSSIVQKVIGNSFTSTQDTTRYHIVQNSSTGKPGQFMSLACQYFKFFDSVYISMVVLKLF